MPLFKEGVLDCALFDAIKVPYSCRCITRLLECLYSVYIQSIFSLHSVYIKSIFSPYSVYISVYIFSLYFSPRTWRSGCMTNIDYTSFLPPSFLFTSFFLITSSFLIPPSSFILTSSLLPLYFHLFHSSFLLPPYFILTSSLLRHSSFFPPSFFLLPSFSPSFLPLRTSRSTSRSPGARYRRGRSLPLSSSSATMCSTLSAKVRKEGRVYLNL